MSEQNRTQPCDCWCQLEYCPVECNKKRAFIHKLSGKDGRFNTSVFCFDELGTPEEAKDIEVECNQVEA